VDGPTERRAIASDRVAEISRGHSRFARELKARTETGVENPCRVTGWHPQSSLRCPWSNQGMNPLPESGRTRPPFNPHRG